MLNTLWKWCTLSAQRTWFAHGLVSLASSVSVAALAGFLGLARPTWVFVGVAAGMLGFFVIREMGDEMRYRRTGQWKKIKWEGVSTEADRAGDLLGPTFVFLAGAAAAWLGGE